MKNLATRNQEDYSIHPDGTAYTTQRKAAEMMGVSRGAVEGYFKPKNVDISQGVNVENLFALSQHYARKGRPEAVSMLVKFGEAGAQAYIYTEAGYTITVARPETVAAIHAPVDYAIVGAMITAAVTAALKGLLGNLPAHAYAVPTEPVVERAAQPFRTLAPGFLPWREARHVYLPGHSEAVFHQVMAAGRVAKQAFDVQFSDMQVNRECISYQENLISFACNAFISQSRRFRRTDGTVTENRWTNPSLDQAYYTYAGDYEPLTFL